MKNDLEHVRSLVGLRVLKMVEDGNRTEWNGLITGHINGLVFILLYDALCGVPTYTMCMREEELARDGRYKFFPDSEALEAYVEAYQKYRDAHYDARKAKETKELRGDAI